jgi:ankyrin repeat protein
MNAALWEASETNNIHLCKQLLEPKLNHGLVAQPNSKGLNDWTALHIAADSGHCDICEILLYHGEMTNINARTSSMRTPLHLACIKAHLNVVELFIQEEADLNCLDNEQNSPLHYASMHGHPVIVKKLIKAGAKLGTKNIRGMFPVDLAGSPAVFRVFRRYFLKNPEKRGSCGYGRSLFGSALLHNSREDMVHKILMKNSQAPRLSELKAL